MKENDLRYYRTRKSILSAMTRLLQTKKFEQITVTTICEEAEISRSGFYLHYVDKYDLIEVNLKEFRDQANQFVQADNENSKKKLFFNMLTYLQNDGKLIAALISENGSIEVQNYIKRMMRENARTNIFPQMDLELENDIEEHYALIFLSNALFGVLQDWINRGQKESIEELVQIMDRLITFDFRK
ncbi:MAG: TetR/AcrR family transcriptional regulator C-terminal domain-containing protein [Enterococcus malodoratus]